ncbi:MAG: tetratricopeptide repeat protein [Deltaproteobacteria bacterium]|nr:MAG: tetratricopeptide repeat protein [Deltaproteobacteria bacterium]
MLEIQANNLGARLLKATIDTIEKKYPEAEKELTTLLRESPNTALIHRQMGVYYQSRGLPKDAEKSLIRALELDPDSEDILSTLTQFYITQKQTDRAIQRIQSVPENKKKAFHYELMGMAYSQAGNAHEAETAYKEALRKEPGRKSSGVYLASQYIQSGRLDEGLLELDRLITNDPSNASLYTTKAFISQVQGKMDAAKESYEQALKVDPTFAAAANNLAYALAEEGRDLQTALQWAQTARQRDIENPDVADTLGWIHYKLGHHILARDQLQFAISKQPDNPEFLYHLALIYKETKQISEAEQALKKALGSKTDFKERNLAQSALDEILKLKVAGKVRS